MSNTFKAINWNKIEDKLSKIFWDQNVRQFWVDEEIPISGDKKNWNEHLTPAQRDIYKKVLISLTLLDTQQASLGMPLIALKVNNPHAKAILQFMGMMEQMHAKSYSTIFCTLCSTQEIDELFVWSENNVHLQKKIEIISKYYQNIHNTEDLYMAMVASVFLESFLFYSGFYYPLDLAGRGLMINSGEIINLIIRDEAVHGLYVGLLSIELRESFDKSTIKKLQQQTIQLLEELMENEIRFTNEVYEGFQSIEDVHFFLKYNANKALQNLGFDIHYQDAGQNSFNPLVLNGLNTSTKNHDFFSTKGNGYIKPTKVEELCDDDFSD